jgi:hypothetical protein
VGNVNSIKKIVQPRHSKQRTLRATSFALDPPPAFAAPPLEPMRARIFLIALAPIGLAPFLAKKNLASSNKYFQVKSVLNTIDRRHNCQKNMISNLGQSLFCGVSPFAAGTQIGSPCG